MPNKIYKLYLINNYTEAGYQLSPEAMGQLWKKAEQNEVPNGAKLLLSCTSRWCDETIQSWGVIEYPDLDAVVKITALNEKDGFFRYIESQTFLGTLAMGEQIPDLAAPEAIYQLILCNDLGNDAWESLSADTRDRIWASVLESIQKWGGQISIGCDTNWSNEQYNLFGVTAWPNVEAIQAHFKDLEKLGWHRYVHSRTILGKKD
jgi:hypothetical protein